MARVPPAPGRRSSPSRRGTPSLSTGQSRSSERGRTRAEPRAGRRSGPRAGPRTVERARKPGEGAFAWSGSARKKVLPKLEAPGSRTTIVRAPGARPRKTVAQSKAELTELMLPNDANPMGKILGGKVLHLIDVAGAIAAHRHSRSAVVTASIDNVDFLHPVHVGDLLVLRSSVNYAGRTSMEVGVKVTSENPVTGEIRHTSTAYLTFVAINEKGERIEVPEIVPESTEEKRRYREAKERRRLRLERVANRRPPRS